MRRFGIWMVLLTALIWLGCASPQAVETGGEAAALPETTETGSAETTDRAAEVAEAAPIESMIAVDPKTGTISGKAAVALLKPLGDEAAFTREKQGIDALIQVINDSTQIECKLQGIVSPTELASLQSPLLIVVAGPDLKGNKVLEALARYVSRGGVVLIDGSWQGNLIPGGRRITLRGNHTLLQEPHKLADAYQRRFRQLDAIQMGNRVGIILTNQNYGDFWKSRPGSPEHTWATQVGINVLVYALKTSRFSKQEKKAEPTKPTPPGGVSPVDIAPL